MKTEENKDEKEERWAFISHCSSATEVGSILPAF